MTFQHAVILGAGAVGSTYGAILSQKIDVMLVGRAKHVEVINSNGLTIVGDYAGTYTLSAATKLKDVPPDTLLIVTTKTYDLIMALKAVRPSIRPDTVILLLQNGLGVKEAAAKVLKGRGVIVRGLVTIAAEMLEPGHIKVWRGETILNSDTVSKKIANLFNTSNMTPRITNNFEREKWRKLIVNCVINPLTAILQVRNHEIGVPELAETRHAIIRECVAVGVAEKVDLGQDLIPFVDRIIPRYTNRSSMYQDVHRGKQTEIDYINGRVVELGKKHSIPTPVNECLVQLVQFLEERPR